MDLKDTHNGQSKGLCVGDRMVLDQKEQTAGEGWTALGCSDA